MLQGSVGKFLECLILLGMAAAAHRYRSIQLLHCTAAQSEESTPYRTMKVVRKRSHGFFAKITILLSQWLTGFELLGMTNI